jgi:flagellar basal body-associated protein FliL
MDTLTVLLLIVALIGAYFAYTNFIGKKPKPADSDSESDSDSDHDAEEEKKEFTFAELAKHTTKSTKIYVSLKGVGMFIYKFND